MEFDNGPFVFRINDNNCGPSLLTQVCLERGWREYNGESAAYRDCWNLWWRTTGFPINHYKQLKTWQFTNHIPKGSSICRKDNLVRYLRCMKKVYGSIFDFSPPGYNLPLEYTKLVAECNRQQHQAEENVWICKPVGQSQGKGIFLFRRLSDLSYDNSAVVQRYIENPLLIGGYKFDLRLYVCIPSYHPLTVYLYTEGLARFGTDKFTLTDLENPYRHLTNCSLNKLGPGYQENKDRVGAGCKWTLKQLRHYLHQTGISDWLLWQRISSLVVLTALSQMNGIPNTANCFEVYGFDVLVDAALRPWLLEVNMSPALSRDCDVDAAVKKPMIHDMFDLIGLPVCNTGLSLFTLWSPPNHRPDSRREEPITSQDESTGSTAVSVAAAAGHWRRRQQNTQRGRKKSAGGGARTQPGAKSRKRSPPPERESALSHVNLNQQINNGEQWIRYNPVIDDRSRVTQRGIHGSALATKRAPPASTARWGNDKDWRNPPAKEGGWVRVYPLGGAVSSHPCALADETLHEGTAGDKAVKTVVAAIHKYSKTARFVSKQKPRLSDEGSSELLRRLLGLGAHVWLPNK